MGDGSRAGPQEKNSICSCCWPERRDNNAKQWRVEPSLNDIMCNVSPVCTCLIQVEGGGCEGGKMGGWMDGGRDGGMDGHMELYMGV